MKSIDDLHEMLSDYRNSVKDDLSDEDLSEVDNYISKITNDMMPMFKLIEKLGKDSSLMKDVKTDIDKIIKEEKWLEKLLKISS